MILTEKVNIKIFKSNIEHYKKQISPDVSLGEIYTIQPCKLPDSSTVIIRAKCDKCGIIKDVTYKQYMKNTKKHTVYFSCSLVCSQDKKKQTLLMNYGVDNPSKSDIIKEKKKKIFLDKYGVDNPSKYKQFKEKRKQTCLNKYDVDNPSKSDIIKHKVESTCLEKYGVSCPSKSKHIHDKMKQTCLDRYGVDNPSKSKHIHDKMKQTCLDRYGVDNPSKHDMFVSKIKHSQLEKSKNLYIEKYAIDILDLKDGIYTVLCQECGQKFDISFYNLQNRIQKQLVVCTICNPLGNVYSSKEKKLFDYITNIYNGEIITNSRKIIPPYEIDIYLPDLNIAFEFNGIYWHSDNYKYNDYHYDKSNMCEENGIQLMHIWEDDWDNKQDIVKSLICEKILFNKNDEVFGDYYIGEVTNKKPIIEFFNENHIYEYIDSQINIGLFQGDDLISLMSFDKSEVGTLNEYRLLNCCNKNNNMILNDYYEQFMYFIKQYEPTKITASVHRCYDDGSIYEALGFEYIDNVRPKFKYLEGGIRTDMILSDYEHSRVFDSGMMLYEWHINKESKKI